MPTLSTSPDETSLSLVLEAYVNPLSTLAMRVYAAIEGERDES